MSDNPMANDDSIGVFKVPTIIAATDNNNKHINADQNAGQSSANVKSAVNDDNSLQDTNTVGSSTPKTVLPEPMTRLTPADGHYFLDQMKNGVIVEHKAVAKSRLVFGRAVDCDIVLAHPSVSRYHAVLLWSPISDDDYESGKNCESFWYLVDCGSTHGTTNNKAPVLTGKLIKLVPNNNVFKLGASTRLFTLGSTRDCNDDDDNDDSDLIEADIDDDSNDGKNVVKKEESKDTGCMWGMSDDAETKGDVTADSKALQSVIAAMKSTTGDKDGQQTTNSNAYIANPYKCIQQWFEREGYDVEYKCDQIHNKFRCTIELPIDGQWIPVEGQLMTKKKESMSDVCLKACQLLDKAELLFPWQQQEAHQQRRKQLEEDKDDDCDMIDETIKISHKKLKKQHYSSDCDNNNVDNYETLNKKWSDINEELRQLRVKMATIGAKASDIQELKKESDDSLDNYMAIIGRQRYGLTMSDKIEKSKIRMKINVLEKEQQKLEKLIKLAKPLLVELQPVSSSTATSLTKPMTMVTSDDNTGDIITIDEKAKNSSKPNSHKVEVNNETKPMTTQETKEEEIKRKADKIISEMKSIAKPKSMSKDKQRLKAQSIVEAIEKEKRLEKTKPTAKTGFDEDFVDWMPPMGQSGDGKTSLNDKFGY